MMLHHNNKPKSMGFENEFQELSCFVVIIHIANIAKYMEQNQT